MTSMVPRRSVYTPVFKELFDSSFPGSWLDPGFLRLNEYLVKNPSSSIAEVLAAHGSGREIEQVSESIYSIPIFKRETCEMLLEEVESFKEYCRTNDIEIYRPNSMNNYGLVLTQMGIQPLLNSLQKEYMLPISKLLFPDVAYNFTSHHSFIVSYKMEEDRHLDMHTDDSDITFNICLGRERFTGSGLTFCGVRGNSDHRKFRTSYQHAIGRAIVHLGEQRHGADNIMSGERHNLIVWNKNEEYRSSEAFREFNRKYQQEGQTPSPQCLSYTHDRDYILYKDYPSMEKNPYFDIDFVEEGGEVHHQHHHRTIPWCPPKGTEYPGFPTDDKLFSILSDKEDEYIAELKRMEGVSSVTMEEKEKE